MPWISTGALTMPPSGATTTTSWMCMAWARSTGSHPLCCLPAAPSLTCQHHSICQLAGIQPAEALLATCCSNRMGFKVLQHYLNSCSVSVLLAGSSPHPASHVGVMVDIILLSVLQQERCARGAAQTDCHACAEGGNLAPGQPVWQCHGMPESEQA